MKKSIYNLIRRIALWFHELHSRAYSYYKIKELGIWSKEYLTDHERSFCLQFHSVLKDESLIVYDIGAAKGTVASCFAKLHNIKIIHAFEPIPDIYKDLLKATQAYSKVYCHNVALGKIEGSLPMYISQQTDSSSLLEMDKLHIEQFPGTETKKMINVPIVKLDEYVSHNKLDLPNIVKIDVQGYEMNVLEGGIETIKQAKYCILEMSLQPLYKDSPLFDDIYKFINQLGFKLIGVTSPLTGESNIQLQLDGIFENQKFSASNIDMS